MNYYNDVDPCAAAWLRQLVEDDLIPDGKIDDRSIVDVRPGDLDGFAQCHFFAGIGGWPLALKMAGWPEDEKVWTGSCPCQPWSCAGKQHGEKDERHLWPEFRRLIGAKKPRVLFGEQVASAAGRGWLVKVKADLENMGYEVGMADLCAAAAGAPHVRQRLYFGGRHVARKAGKGTEPSPIGEGPGVQVRVEEVGRVDPGSQGIFEDERDEEWWRGFSVGLADGGDEGLEGLAGDVHDGDESGRVGEEAPRPIAEGGCPGWNGECRWHRCKDGKYRRIPAKFKIQRMVNGVSRVVERGWNSSDEEILPLVKDEKYRVAFIRGYGNAVVPQLASKFIQAWSHCS